MEKWVPPRDKVKENPAYLGGAGDVRYSNQDINNVHWILVNLCLLLLCCELAQPIGNNEVSSRSSGYPKLVKKAIVYRTFWWDRIVYLQHNVSCFSHLSVMGDRLWNSFTDYPTKPLCLCCYPIEANHLFSDHRLIRILYAWETGPESAAFAWGQGEGRRLRIEHFRVPNDSWCL